MKVPRIDRKGVRETLTLNHTAYIYVNALEVGVVSHDTGCIIYDRPRAPRALDAAVGWAARQHIPITHVTVHEEGGSDVDRSSEG